MPPGAEQYAATLLDLVGGGGVVMQDGRMPQVRAQNGTKNDERLFQWAFSHTRPAKGRVSRFEDCLVEQRLIIF